MLVGKLPGSEIAVYLIDRPAYFDRSSLYQRDGADYQDNSERFIFFQRAVLETIRLRGSGPTSSTATTGRRA